VVTQRICTTFRFQCRTVTRQSLYVTRWLFQTQQKIATSKQFDKLTEGLIYTHRSSATIVLRTALRTQYALFQVVERRRLPHTKSGKHLQLVSKMIL